MKAMKRRATTLSIEQAVQAAPPLLGQDSPLEKIFLDTGFLRVLGLTSSGRAMGLGRGLPRKRVGVLT